MKNRTLLTLLCLLLAAVLCFAGCGSQAEETQAPTAAPTEAPATEAPTEAPTEEPTEAPTEAPTVYTNALTGEVLEEAQTTRIFGVTINNIPAALPHIGVSQADLFFEMFVNDYATRGLALYTDITKVERIGSVRSLRYNFTDLAIAYDAVIAHAGGSDEVLGDARRNDIAHINISTDSSTSYSLRDKDRYSNGYAIEHCLFAKGEGLYKHMEEKGYRVTRKTDKDYGLHFTEDGTPEAGEAASKINITFNLKGNKKLTTMTYSEDLGKYIYTQYGKQADSVKEENLEAFENVFVIITKVRNDGVYHVADLLGSGEGYFACGGKIIPVQWHHEAETDAITFTLTNGNPLIQGIGNSYIAIVPTTSTVSYE